jgi:mannose-6-phosphate isomerase-like protein (cupin superfamily)
MSEELALGPATALKVLGRTDDLLELEATYAGGGSPPPAHFHPAQDERFEVLTGTMRVRMDGAEREITAGDVLEIPSGTVHAMWNEGDEPAVVNWHTMPAGRTLDWFREVAAVLRGEGRPNPEDLLTDYADVYRLADG